MMTAANRWAVTVICMATLAGCEQQGVGHRPPPDSPWAMERSVTACENDHPARREGSLAQARCVVAAETRMFAGLPIADLIGLRSNKRLDLARQVDAGTMTEPQVNQEIITLNSQLKLAAIARRADAMRGRAPASAAGRADMATEAEVIEWAFRP